MKNKKIDIELDLEDLLGLSEPKKGTLDYDLNFIINNGYDEIVKFISLDLKRRIAVDCFTCIKGMDLSKQYGKPKRKE